MVSVTQFHSGTADNVIPDEAFLGGTVRTFSLDTQRMVMDRMQAIVDGQAAAYGVSATLSYEKGYPPTINSADQVALAAEVAREIAGNSAVNDEAGARWGRGFFLHAECTARRISVPGSGRWSWPSQPRL